MKGKSICQVFKDINNKAREAYSSKYITGNQFEGWLKSKKKDSITYNESLEGYIINNTITYEMQKG